VHFPLDVAAGGLLGIIVIALAFVAYKKTGTIVQNKLAPLLITLFPLNHKKHVVNPFVPGRGSHDPR
jgi:membrane-associated phospholipid phosphatase